MATTSQSRRTQRSTIAGVAYAAAAAIAVILIVLGGLLSDTRRIAPKAANTTPPAIRANDPAPIERQTEAAGAMTLYQTWPRDPRRRPAPGPATWREGVWPEGSIFVYSGEFVDLPGYITVLTIGRTGTWAAARSLVADPAFRITRDGKSWSIWALLEQLELSLPADHIQCLPVSVEVTLEQVQKAHGPADHVGGFQHDSSAAGPQPPKVSRAYWYGPICVVVDATGKVFAVAGWPSCL